MPSDFEPFLDSTAGMPPVQGFLHRPDGGSSDALVLAHGAGANCNAALLVAVASEFAAAGFTVLRCDLPFRQIRTSGPPRPGDAAIDRRGLMTAVFALRKLASGRIFLGGHSYGGRQATMLAAEEPSLAHGLLLLSYPLHPPGRPEQLRTSHFPKLQTHAFFAHGSRDPFGSLEEMRSALSLISAPTSLMGLDGAGHDLALGKKASGASPVSARIGRAFRNFMS